jgi:hypothetical protein
MFNKAINHKQLTTEEELLFNEAINHNKLPNEDWRYEQHECQQSTK